MTKRECGSMDPIPDCLHTDTLVKPQVKFIITELSSLNKSLSEFDDNIHNTEIHWLTLNF